MKKARLTSTGLVLASSFWGVLACHDNATAPDPGMEDFEGYIFLQPQLMVLYVGQTGLFEATIRGHAPELEALLLELEWTSLNPQIVVVNSDGTVTGIAEGEAVIVARAPDGAEARARVTVRSPDRPDEKGDQGGEEEQGQKKKPPYR